MSSFVGIGKSVAEALGALGDDNDAHFHLAGTQRVKNKLRRLLSDQPEVARTVLGEMAEVMISMNLAGTKHYPPERPDQVYERRPEGDPDKLSNSFDYYLVGMKADLVIKNTANEPKRGGRVFSEWVIGEFRQTGDHSNNWWTIGEQALKEPARSMLVERLTEGYEDLWERS